MRHAPRGASTTERMTSKVLDLNLVVTCTDRKRFVPVDALRVQTLPHGTVAERHKNWIERLRTVPSGLIPASDLYVGNHWHVVRGIVARAKSENIAMDVWVLSAGYGLIPFDAPLKPYAASFSPGPDQVVRTSEIQLWWAQLATWQGPLAGAPRTLHQLADRSKAVPMVVAASAPYVRAALPDLAKAQAILTEKRLAVISTGFGGSDALGSALLRSDKRMISERGGTAHTLNVKLAAWSIDSFEHWRKDLSVLHSQFDRAMERLAPSINKSGRPHTDAEVRSFIEERLVNNATSYTVLLREFRDNGLACEQKRFKRLYAAVAAQRPL